MQIADKIMDAKIEKRVKEVIYSLKAEALICIEEYEIAAHQLITFSKDYPLGYFHLAVIRHKNDDLRGAIKILDRTIEVGEKSGMRHFQYYMLKADVLKRLGEESYKEFEETA